MNRTYKRTITTLTTKHFPVLLFFGLACYSSTALAQPAGTFTPTGSLIAAEPSPLATFLSDGKVLVTGQNAELYDPVSGSFSRAGTIDSRTLNSCTRLPDGRVLIAGGVGPADTTLATAELYDPGSGLFTATGNMTIPRAGHNAVLLNTGKVLIVGGGGGRDIPAELFDPDSGTFMPTGSFAGAGPDTVTATLLADGRVLVIAYYSFLAGLYDPATETFSTIGAGVEASTGTLLANGKVLFTGGTSDDGSTARAYLYDPQTQSFSATGLMRASRLNESATLLGDGTVLIAGGQVLPGDGTGPALASAEIYDSTTGTFSLTGTMITTREVHGAALLPDGTVLVAGGSGGAPPIPGQDPSTLAEIYHPAVPVRRPTLFTLAGTGQGQGAIWNSLTGQIASPSTPATAGDVLSMYTNNLIQGGVIPPQIAVGGRLAKVLFAGNAPGYQGYYQVNFQVPGGVVPGSAVSVRLTYLDRASNEVTIGVQ